MIICEACEAEFKIKILNELPVKFCPCCGEALHRRLQQWFRDLLIEKLNIHPEDIESRSMGAGGEDLIMARAARHHFPYSIECKNVEKLNVWEAYKQAQENSKDHEPIVVMKKNNHKALIVVDAEHFVNLSKKD